MAVWTIIAKPYNLSSMYNDISMGLTKMRPKLEKCRSLETLCFRECLPATTANRVKQKAKITTNLQPFIRQEQRNMTEESRKAGAIASQARLQRVKSEENLLNAPTKKQYEDIIEIYQNQNGNLKKQNQYLLRELKKRKRNQENLCMYIEQLRRQVSQLQDKNLIENYCMNSNATSSEVVSKLTVEDKPMCWAKVTNNNGRKVSAKNSFDTEKTKNDTFFSSGILATEDDDEVGPKQGYFYQENMEDLAKKFNTLMDQCSNEPNKKIRDVLRKKLAETAERMRNFRKQYSCNKL